MKNGSPERRLAAIVAIDVVGYSRLMGADEAGTLSVLKAHQDILTPMVGEHGGRLVSTAGDGLLLEFPSVVEALECSIGIQAVMEERNADIPDEQKMLFRIGVNLGDIIIHTDNDVFGDGVNVAARIEQLAPPGGICLSRTVRDHVGERIDVDFEDMGEIAVKNIAKPIRVFRVLKEGEVAAPRPKIRPAWQKYTAMAVVVVVLIAGGAGWLWQAGWFTSDAAESNRGPRIAVLPFDRFDKKDDGGFADGLAEDVITHLSYFQNLQVIARNSSFKYRGKSIDVREVGRELKADYVLEGSVRSGSGRVRVTAQLIDAESGDHVWADTYDRKLTAANIFKVQDDIVASIVANIGGLSGEIAQNELADIKTTRPKSLSGYKCVLLSKYIANSVDNKRFPESMSCLRSTVKSDPEYSDGWAWTATMIFQAITFGLDAGEQPILRMLEAAERAISANPKNPEAHMSLGHAQFVSKRKNEAISSYLHALKLNEHDPDKMGWVSFFLIHLGEFDVAKPMLDRALELTPNPPPQFYFAKFHYHYAKQEFDQALLAIKSIRSDPNYWFQQLFAGIALVELDRLDEAKAMIAKAKKIEPNAVPIMQYNKGLWWWALPDKGIGYVQALAKAGLDLTPQE